MKSRAILLILFAFIVSSCSLGAATEVASNTPWPTPTSHTLFSSTRSTPETVVDVQAPVAATPTVSAYFTERGELTAEKPVTSQTAYQGPTPIVDRTTIISATIYDDRLNPNWKIVRSQGMEFERVVDSELARSGDGVLAVSPTQDFGTFHFVVDEATDEVYRLDDALGVSFWLSGGDDLIANDELAVAVLGSNDYPHWVPDDDSVDFNGGGTFSETRLYFLDINNTIPPNTWVEVVVWLDNLQYDPDYEYVTGFYIKNDEGYHNTFYVDDVTLLMLPTGEAEPATTREP